MTLLTCPFNLVKMVQSSAGIEDYIALMTFTEAPERTLLVSLPLPEFLSFAAVGAEVFEIDTEYKSARHLSLPLRTHCRLDHDFVSCVLADGNEFTEYMGKVERINAELTDLPARPNKHMIQHHKTVFTVAIPVRDVGSDVPNTMLQRGAIRLAVGVLERYANLFRRYHGIAWASVPHYSFYSFPYAYVREYDGELRYLSSDKYMMYPATGVHGRGHVVDPDGTELRNFRERLVNLSDTTSYAADAIRKGEAYSGQGHDLVALHLCVSAIESALRAWVIRKQVPFKGKNLARLPVTSLLELWYGKPLDLGSDVLAAIDLRHTIGHRESMSVDSDDVFPAIATLRSFFDEVEADSA
jgi:hypothetical protein